MLNLKNYRNILAELEKYGASLVAVSKLKSNEDISELVANGQKAFGENYVQELVEKNKSIPEAEWHFIGHLQSNKVKSIIPFVTLIHGIDSLKLLEEVNKQARAVNKIQDCLLQIHIAEEETKFGFSIDEAETLLNSKKLLELRNISVKGLMSLATLSDDKNKIRIEFKRLGEFFNKYKSNNFSILSMGMTSDYKIALEEGSTMVRIGSAIFGERK